MGNNSKKKIAYLLEYPLDLAGGAQMSTESLCRGLLSTGYESVVVCPALLKKKTSDYPFAVREYPMGEKRINNLLIRIKAFKRILKEEKPDIVHIQMPESLITYGLTGLSYKMIFTDRGLYYGYRPHTMLPMKIFLKKAEVLLTTTDFNRNMWYEGSSVRPIEKVANTISEKFLEFDASKKAENELLTIGFAGRICEEKNWPFAVKLVEFLAEKGLKFKVKLVLSVFEEGDDEKVTSVISGMGAAVGRDNLEFHQDYNQQQMQEYYYGVDVFIMTSVFESFGKAAVEAMSRKCALLSTRAGGLPEVIGREENLYDENSLSKVFDYLMRCDADREFLKREQEYFYSRYRESFSQDRCLKDHLAIYDRVLE